MSVSVSASIVVGFEVRHEDFWVAEEACDPLPSCPNRHLGVLGKFCSECGGKIEFQTRQKAVATPNFAKFVGDDDPLGRAGEAWSPKWINEHEQMSPEHFQDLKLLRVNPVQTCDDPDEGRTLVLGLEPRAVHDVLGSIEGTAPAGLALSDLEHLFERCRVVAHALGVDRPVRLYLTSYCSY